MEKSDLLNAEKADALCTMVTFGFLAMEPKIKVEYDDEKDAEKYNGVAARFEKFMKKRLSVSKSTKQSKMPFIVAKTSRMNGSKVGEDIFEDNITYWNTLHVNANNADPAPPRGAYIGGLAAIGAFCLVGPSKLELQPPVYRKISAKEQSDISKAYTDAMTSTNIALGVIRSTISHNKDKINLENLIREVSTEYKPNHLFKSYHGMIQAMELFSTVPDNNAFIFEFAMGKGTAKVSSCLPCSIYMAAKGNPPTSTHLGRGDNWAISDRDWLRSAWESNIIRYYTKGLEMLGNKGIPEIDHFLIDLAACKCTDLEIPKIFLEALTFERSFTERIINTIPLPPQ